MHFYKRKLNHCRFSIVLLAAEVVSSVGSGLPFGFLEAHSRNPPHFRDANVQSVIKCVCPSSFSRSGMNRGLLHSDFLVRNCTLRLLLEGLKFLGDFSGALDRSSQVFPGNLQTWTSLRDEIWNQVQTLLPDAQVLVNLLSPISSSPGGIVSYLNKRPVDAEGDRSHNAKKMKTNNKHEEADMVVSGVTFSPNTGSGNPVEKGDQLSDGNDILCAFVEIWSLDISLLPTYTTKDAEVYLYSKLMEALHAYLVSLFPPFFFRDLNYPLSPLFSLLISYAQFSYCNNFCFDFLNVDYFVRFRKYDTCISP